MANLLDSKNFGTKIYSRFPTKYKEDDVSQNYALKRYIEALSDGGYSLAIEDINGITSLIDPDKVDANILPVLFEQYGLTVFNGIPESYLRYLLPKLSEAYEQKGSLTVIEFITSALTGVKVYLEVQDLELTITLEMDSSVGQEYFPDSEKFGRIIDKFLPFYFGRNLIYAYVFYENQTLKPREEYDMEVTDFKEEYGTLPSYRIGIPTMLNNTGILLNSTFILNPEPTGDYVDSHVDNIKYNYLEPITISNKEEDDLISFNLIFDEKHKVDVEEDVMIETTTTVYDETPKLWRRGRSVIGSALFGDSKLGDIVLGENRDYSDEVIETVRHTVEESCGFLQFLDTNTNSELYALNDNFYTNANGDHMEFSYDVITINGEQTTIYHY